MKQIVNTLKDRLKYLWILSILFALHSCKQNQYVDGKKDGNWIEYLDSNRVSEVSKDSAYFVRKIKYNKGMPEGVVSDSKINITKAKFEFQLISGPYLQNSKRPEDKLTGVRKEFDDKNGKIVNFNYFDQFGVIDPRTYFIKGFELINDDERFDSLYFCTLNDKKNKIQSFQKFHNRPDLFDKEAASITAKALANPSIKKLINNDKQNIFLYVVLLDALEENGKNFKIFFDLEKQLSLNGKHEIQPQKEKLYDVPCVWCGRIFVMKYKPITNQWCSMKCQEETRIYNENKRYR